METRWDLDTIFPGGSHSKEFAHFLENLKQEIEGWALLSEKKICKETILQMQQIDMQLRHACHFADCLTAQNVQDQKAAQLVSTVTTLSAAYETTANHVEKQLTSLDEKAFSQLLQDSDLQEIAFVLKEKRDLAKHKLSREQEAVINDLSIDGLHGWSQLYDTIVGHVTVPIQQEKEITHLSVNQAYNLLNSPKREERAKIFTAWEGAWQAHATLAAQALNHLAGFRLKRNQKRGWRSILQEPLQLNRISEKTLHTMWDTINANKAPFFAFLREKAQKLGVAKLSWHDLNVPTIPIKTKFPYENALPFLVAECERFHPQLGTFAKKCIAQKIFEVEDRAEKQAGGFCAALPLKKQSRIFMTYSDTPENLLTLAHELGHAYHNEKLFPLPGLVQDPPMTVAETASTFLEQVLFDAMLRTATSESDKRSFLENKVERSILFFMNIQARYLFELAFYKERERGFVSASRLSELMVEAQKEAYGDVLGEYHPHFWAAKGHFYSATMPFYNFPYTFGYLFSLGLYHRALQEPSSFMKSYDALLEDTGRMTVEELVQKHLGEDTTQPTFWQSALDIAIGEVEQLVKKSMH